MEEKSKDQIISEVLQITLTEPDYIKQAEKLQKLMKVTPPSKYLIDNMEKSIQNVDMDTYKQIVENKVCGIADLVVEEFKGTIIITSSTGGYIFNDKTKLFEPQFNFDKMIYCITDFLVFKVKCVMDDLLKLEGKSKELTNLCKIYESICNFNMTDKVFKLAKSRLTDSNFEALINSIPNLLPIQFFNENEQNVHGVIDLMTLEVRERVKEDLFSFEIDCSFIKDEKRLKHAVRFFKDIMNDRDDCYNYLQEVLGYAITGETDARTFFVLWGNGSNGKSEMMKKLQQIVTDVFYQPVDKQIFIKDDKARHGHTSYLIPLMRARIAVYSETEEHEKLNESMLKQLTGGDKISAREIYGRQTSFIPKAKYFILTNHKPTFNIDQQAMIDRFRYIPFDARFSHNPVLGEKKLIRILSDYWILSTKMRFLVGCVMELTNTIIIRKN